MTLDKQLKTNMKTIKRESVAPANSRVAAGFGRVDYCDSYRLTKSTAESPEQIATQLFNMPKWVVALLNVRNRMVRPFGCMRKMAIQESPITDNMNVSAEACVSRKAYNKMTDISFCHFLPFKKAVFSRQILRSSQKTP
jgi:hypothetical protein